MKTNTNTPNFNIDLIESELRALGIDSPDSTADILLHKIADRPIEFYQPTDKQLPFHRSDKRLRFFIASNRSGKSTAGGVEMIWWLTGTHPYLNTPPPPIEAWIVSLDHQQQRDGSQRRILEHLPRELIKRAPIIQRDIIDFIELTNGSKVTFKSFEAETEKFAAAELDCVWLDEEPPADKYKEISMRLLGKNKLGSLWCTMTPLKGLSWTYRVYYRPYLKGENKNFDVFEAEIWDNPHIPINEAIDEIRRLCTPAELEARLRGKYTILAGKSVFPKDELQSLIDIAPEPIKGSLVTNDDDSLEFVDNGGDLELYEYPEENALYVIGADVSEGLGITDTKRDYSVAVVLKREPLKVVGVFRSNTIREDIFAETLLKLGLWYNEALIGVEDNSYGKIVNFILANGNEYQESYLNLYRRETFDEGTRQMTEKIGWRTTFESKQRLISSIRTALYEQTLILPSLTILDELSTYILDEHGKAIEEQGSYSDCIIALGISLQLHESLGTGEITIISPSEQENRMRLIGRTRIKQPADHYNDLYRDDDEHYLLK